MSLLIEKYNTVMKTISGFNQKIRDAEEHDRHHRVGITAFKRRIAAALKKLALVVALFYRSGIMQPW